MYEILQAIPPAHLKFIQESENEAMVPFGGKYTWDALFNSVMYSPLWASFNFQLIDHIVYSRYGAIPSFAFTKVRRLTPTHPIPVTEGLLSRKCIQNRFDTTYNNDYIGELEAWVDTYNAIQSRPHLEPYTQKPARARPLTPEESYYNEKYKQDIVDVTGRSTDINTFTPHLKNMYMGTDTQYYYYDFADHYAIECVLVLDDSEPTISAIKTLVNHPNDVLPFDCWKDNMINRVLLQTVEFFPRQWFDCTNSPIQYYENSRLKEVLGNELKTLENKPFFSQFKDDRNTIVGWLAKILWKEYHRYCNSLDINYLPNILIDGRMDYETDGFLKYKTNDKRKRYASSFVEYIKTTFNNYEKNRLARENALPFNWTASPVSNIAPPVRKHYNMVEINRAVFKYFNRFLEREILNRIDYANMRPRTAKAKAATFGRLYDLGYDINANVGIIQDRKNALKNINRGLTRNIRNTYATHSASLASPTQVQASGPILYTAPASVVGGRHTRRRKHRAMTRRKRRQQKRHTRKH